MGILNYLQPVGRALMVPVATLPAAALLMGIGYWIDPDSWGGSNLFAALLIKSGSAIINHMPALFAIGVAYGMSKDKDGAAALSGFVGFLVITQLCAPDAVALIKHIPLEQVPAAFDNIDNPFVGILSGILAAEIYNRFSHVELPSALSFFSGRRLVPILVSLVMIIVGCVLLQLWPVVYGLLTHFGQDIQKMGSFGAGLYAFFNRLLIPVGLHHALNSVFWFNVAGINDIPNFLGGAESIAHGSGIVGITGRYQAGFFPVMMFGLPGAALAIWRCARPENRGKVGSIMLAAAFAAFFTGITEPLEFSFMFVAPPLYVIHAFLTGLSVFIAASMHWMAGFGFSAGLVDLLLSANNPLATQWYMLIPQGLVFFFVYYFVFRFTIIKFNLKTLGRELQADADETLPLTADRAQPDEDETQLQSSARRYINALGGASNLLDIDACITRLRLRVIDSSLVNDDVIKSVGASGVIRLGSGSIQIIVGTKAETLAEAMKIWLKQQLSATHVAAQQPSQSGPTVAMDLAENPAVQDNGSFITLYAPVSGQIVPLDQVPDTAFASKAVGEGLAIRPTANLVVAPLAGTLVKIFATNHAFCLETEQGVELIVHMGLDTVALAGQGFRRLVAEGSKVNVGQPILEMDLTYLTAHARSMLSPVVISNSDEFSAVQIITDGQVIGGETAIILIKK